MRLAFKFLRSQIVAGNKTLTTRGSNEAGTRVGASFVQKVNGHSVEVTNLGKFTFSETMARFGGEEGYARAEGMISPHQPFPGNIVVPNWAWFRAWNPAGQTVRLGKRTFWELRRGAGEDGTKAHLYALKLLGKSKAAPKRKTAKPKSSGMIRMPGQPSRARLETLKAEYAYEVPKAGKPMSRPTASKKLRGVLAKLQEDGRSTITDGMLADVAEARASGIHVRRTSRYPQAQYRWHEAGEPLRQVLLNLLIIKAGGNYSPNAIRARSHLHTVIAALDTTDRRKAVGNPMASAAQIRRLAKMTGLDPAYIRRVARKKKSLGGLPSSIAGMAHSKGLYSFSVVTANKTRWSYEIKKQRGGWVPSLRAIRRGGPRIYLGDGGAERKTPKVYKTASSAYHDAIAPHGMGARYAKYKNPGHKSARQKAHAANAKKAMKLHHETGMSLRDAWDSLKRFGPHVIAGRAKYEARQYKRKKRNPRRRRNGLVCLFPSDKDFRVMIDGPVEGHYAVKIWDLNKDKIAFDGDWDHTSYQAARNFATAWRKKRNPRRRRNSWDDYSYGEPEGGDLSAKEIAWERKEAKRLRAAGRRDGRAGKAPRSEAGSYLAGYKAGIRQEPPRARPDIAAAESGDIDQIQAYQREIARQYKAGLLKAKPNPRRRRNGLKGVITDKNFRVMIDGPVDGYYAVKIWDLINDWAAYDGDWEHTSYQKARNFATAWQRKQKKRHGMKSFAWRRAVGEIH